MYLSLPCSTDSTVLQWLANGSSLMTSLACPVVVPLPSPQPVSLSVQWQLPRNTSPPTHLRTATASIDTILPHSYPKKTCS